MNTFFRTLRLSAPIFLVAAILFVSPTVASAATCNSTGSGTLNWNTSGTWTCGHVPNSGDVVTISDGDTVSVNTAASAGTLIVNGTNTTSLNISGANSLHVFGNASISNGTAVTLAVGAGSLQIDGNLTLTGGSMSRTANLTIGTGTATVNGNVVMAGPLSSLQKIVFTGTGILNVAGSLDTDGTLTSSTGTVNFNGVGVQPVPAYGYNNLVLSGSGAKSLPSGTAIAGNLSIAPTGSATANIGAGLTINVTSLTLGGLGRINGTWGSTSSTATHTNNTYFAATTGKINVSSDTRTTPTVVTWPTASAISYTQALSASTLSGGVPPVAGSFAFTSPTTIPASAGTYSASVTFTPTDTTSYNSVVSNINVTVNKASSTTVVTCPASVTYNGAAQTPCTATVTGVGGLSLTPTPTHSSNTNAGTASASYTYAGDTNHTGSTDSKNFTINKATPTILVTPYSVTYDGSAHTATGSATGVLAESLSGLDLSGTTHTNAATYNNDPWEFTDVTGNYNNANGTVNDLISKANQTITFGALADKTYGDVDFPVTATSNSALTVSFGVSGNCSLTGNTVYITGAGSCTVTASQAGDTNYNAATSVPQSFTINKANALVSVNGYTGIYDSLAHGATGTATGVFAEDLSSELHLGSTFTNAPGGTASWTFDGDANYDATSGNVAITIGKAAATILVTPYDVTYDGSSHVAVGTAQGVLNESLSGLDLTGTTHTAAGTYATDAWVFTDVTGNYLDDAGTVNDNISKASAVISISPYSVTYDALPHTAVGTAAGVNLEDLSGLLTLTGTTHTNAGTYATDAWTFAGNANYNPENGIVSDSIAKADATILVTPYTVDYDASAHTAAGTATGVLGEPLIGLDLSGTTHTTVGIYNDTWSFTDVTGNYNDDTDTATDSIGKIDATIVVNGYSGAYDGVVHGATGTATGVSGANLGGLLDLGASFTNVPGGTADWTFAGDANYNSDSGSVAITLTKVNLTATADDQTIQFGDPDPAFTAHYSGFVNGETSAVIDTPATAAVAGAHTAPGTYTIVPAGASDTNYSFSYANGVLTIEDHVNPVVTVPADMTAEATDALGATVTFSASATDNVDGPLTAICLPASGSVFALGHTAVNCHATDSSGNTGTASFDVLVEDTTAPDLTVPTDITEEATTSLGNVVTFSTTATDDVDSNVDVVCSPVSGSTFAVDTTLVSCTATDDHTNATTHTFNVAITDLSAPIITRNGPASINLGTGDSYVDAGATASDIVDGPVAVTVGGDTVNTLIPGTYTITYNAVDFHGNHAVQVTRSVIVADDDVPVITLGGTTPVTVEVHTPYTDAGAAAVDNVDPSVTVVTTGTVDVDTVGDHTLHYNAQDVAGNHAIEVTRLVHVVDTTIPTITLNGIDPETVQVHGSYSDAGAVAHDNYDADAPVTATGSVNVHAVGPYVLTYNHTDAHGNVAATITRTVNVVDTTAPVIAAHADVTTEATSNAGAIVAYTAPSVTDNLDPTTVASCAPLAGTNFALGNTLVTCTHTDSNGNPADPVTFTVHVVDTAAPSVDPHADIIIESPVATAVSFTAPASHDAVDGDDVTLCTPASGSVFSMGSTTVTCSDSDVAGNGPTSTTFVVGVYDTTVPPTPVIDTTPPALASTTLFAFAFHDTEAGVTLECRILADGFGPCDSATTFSGNTAPGTQTFEVRAKDASNNVSGTATYTWTIDTTPPVITIDPYTTTPTNLDVVVTASTNEGALNTTTHTFTTNSSFDFVAIDAAGNVTTTTVTITNIDKDAPDTTILTSPTNPTNSTSAAFTFTSTEAGTFTCSIDAAPGAPCTSGVDYTLLGNGLHTFTVAATDAVGNTDPTPAAFGWTVDTQGPTVAITNPGTTGAAGSIVYSTGDSASVACTLDGNVVTCTNAGPYAFSGLSDGQHTFVITGTDDLGNTGTDSATWTVDATGPDVTIIAPLGGDVTTKDVDVTYDINGSTSVACTLDTAAYSCNLSGSVSLTDLSNGPHTFTVTGTDALSNAGPEASVTFTVDREAPTITLNGSSDVIIQVGTAYVDADAIAHDNIDTDTPVITPDSVDFNTIGDYVLHYNYTDSHGNAALEVTRAVHVVAVPPVNQDPVLDTVVPQTVTVGDTVTFTANATDADLDVITYGLSGEPAGASIDSSTGAFTWDTTGVTPDTYIFEVTANDGQGGTDSTSVSITVNAVATPGNTAPVASNGSVSTTQDTSVGITLVATDADVADILTYATTTNPLHGTLSGTGSSLTYTPNAGYTGPDSFTFKANDGTDDSNTATISITVDAIVPANNPPVATADSATTDENVAVIISVLTNDTDADSGDTLTVSNVGQGANGSVTTDGTTVTYTPHTGFSGSDSFPYTVSDGHSGTDTVMVTITVNFVDTEAPVITLLGSNPTTINVGETYSDLGATVTDDHDSNLGYMVSVDAGATTTPDHLVLDSSSAGTHTIFFSATDGAGNVGTTTRTVIVQTPVPAPVTPPSSNGGGGTPLNFVGFAAPTPGVVLGAATSTVPTGAPLCSTPLLTKYMRRGIQNDVSEVKKLQAFLNGEVHAGLPITGFFGPLTEAAVKAFQLKYASEVLTPWGITAPTGYVYKTTEWKINALQCSTLNAPMPQL